ncbi:MAG: STAS domain-containing protein, partial [Pseudomonadota bacterium]|nr:STAS domain-containing protein [Pseudomonadota bacterium]
AGIIHALTLLAILLIAAPLAAHIPLAVLAAILMLVAWNMGEWHEFARLKNFPVTYRTILLATFFLTVIFDITVAVEVGLILASLFFIYRISQITRIESIPLASAEAGRGVEAYRLFGSLFFGAVSKLEAINDPSRFAGAGAPRVIVFDLTLLISLDTTGIDALDTLRRQLATQGGTLILAGPHEQPSSMLARSGFIERLGADNVVPDMPAALSRANALLASA